MRLMHNSLYLGPKAPQQYVVENSKILHMSRLRRLFISIVLRHRLSRLTDMVTLAATFTRH